MARKGRKGEIMAVANIPGISTLKMKLGYAIETTAGVAPTEYLWLQRANTIGGIDLSTETIDASAIEDDKTRTIAGRQDTGGEWTFSFNLTNETAPVYQKMLDDAAAALADNKRTWFTVWSPYLDKAFFIVAQPGGTLPMPGVDQNSLLVAELSLAIDEYKGLMDAIEPKDTTTV